MIEIYKLMPHPSGENFVYRVKEDKYRVCIKYSHIKDEICVHCKIVFKFHMITNSPPSHVYCGNMENSIFLAIGCNDKNTFYVDFDDPNKEYPKVTVNRPLAPWNF